MFIVEFDPIWMKSFLCCEKVEDYKENDEKVC